jgi:Mg2+ and Co2+ transporter CorA
MKELLINQIAPIVATAIVAILVKIIYQIGEPAIQLFVKLKEEAEQRIIASGHESDLTSAKEVWNIIEEKFRITENASTVLGSKADLFDKLLLTKIPGLTQDNLDSLRQAIAGEVNKGKAALVVDDTAAQIAALQQANAQLSTSNATLQSQMSTIQSAIAGAVVTNVASDASVITSNNSNTTGEVITNDATNAETTGAVITGATV